MIWLLVTSLKEESCFFGFGMGGVVPMQGAVVGAAFGRESFGRVMGAMRPPMAVIHLLGTPFAGWVFDVTGSYDVAFMTFLGMYAFAAVVVLLLRVETRAGHGAGKSREQRVEEPALVDRLIHLSVADVQLMASLVLASRISNPSRRSSSLIVSGHRHLIT